MVGVVKTSGFRISPTGVCQISNFLYGAVFFVGYLIFIEKEKKNDSEQ